MPAPSTPRPWCASTWPGRWRGRPGDSTLRGGYTEHLAQVGHVGLVLAHVLARRVAELGHRLAVAADHLDHDVERFGAGVVAEVGAHAEGQQAAAAEVFVELHHLGDVQP